jgi:hypothetical protein
MREHFHHATCILAAARRSAPQIALMLLLAPAPLLAQGQSAVSYNTLVIVDFPSRACAALWPALQSEFEQSKAPELLGGSVVWMTQDQFQEGMEFRLIYEIKLRGNCRLDAPSDNQIATGTPLGWVFMVNENIQPFIFVDCDRLIQMLHRELRNKPIAECRRILARAISRIIVHEMTHIVTQSPLHAKSGLQKAHVTPHDLLAYHTE